MRNLNGEVLSSCVECHEMKADPEEFYDGLRCKACCEKAEKIAHWTPRECHAGGVEEAECGQSGGFVTDEIADVNCPACVKIYAAEYAIAAAEVKGTFTV